MVGFGSAGAAIGSIAGWAFSETTLAASISWRWFQLTNEIGSTSYAIGRAFEDWFYKAYRISSQQVRSGNSRLDAIFRGTIVELKNYNWGKYNSFSGIASKFGNQGAKYMNLIGEAIGEQTIESIKFLFSSEPPGEVIEALEKIGVTVEWLK